MLEDMEAEHAVIDPQLAATREAFAAMCEHPCDDHRNALDLRLVAVRESLLTHLAHEEGQALPMLQRTLTVEENAAFERAAQAAYPARMVPFLLPWAFAGLPDPVRATDAGRLARPGSAWSSGCCGGVTSAGSAGPSATRDAGLPSRSGPARVVQDMPLTDVAPIEATIEIDAPQDHVWELVSDLTRMPRWSPQVRQDLRARRRRDPPGRQAGQPQPARAARVAHPGDGDDLRARPEDRLPDPGELDGLVLHPRPDRRRRHPRRAAPRGPAGHLRHLRPDDPDRPRRHHRASPRSSSAACSRR